MYELNELFRRIVRIINKADGITEAFGILEMPGAALVASAAGETRIAGTFPQRIADGRRASGSAAVARNALRMSEISRLALIASRSAVARLADTLAGILPADFFHRSSRIAVAIY